MKKNYRVTIENGDRKDTFSLLGTCKKAVEELCRTVHIGTGWSVKSVKLATKDNKPRKQKIRQLTLF